MSGRLSLQRFRSVKVKSVLDLLRYRIRDPLGRHPWLFYTLYRPSSRTRRLMVRRDTELVIEGFPRSANTFAVVAFQYAQERDVRLAHHLHVQAQILRGVALGAPVCVLIREPLDAAKSLVVRIPSIPVGMVLKSYIDFYTDIYPLTEHCVVATFEEVTSDFGAVIERINETFNTNFASFKPTRTALEEVISEVEAINKRVGKGLEEHVSRPSEIKDRWKREVTTEGSEDLARKAQEIYEMYLREAKTGS